MVAVPQGLVVYCKSPACCDRKRQELKNTTMYRKSGLVRQNALLITYHSYRGFRVDLLFNVEEKHGKTRNSESGYPHRFTQLGLIYLLCSRLWYEYSPVDIEKGKCISAPLERELAKPTQADDCRG